MDFPALVYRCPGPHQRKGGTFDYRSVQDEEQFAKTLTDGWFPTMEEAIDGKRKDVPSDDDAPTRAELEQKAEELGIKFDGRTSDKKLRDLISATLEE